MNDIANQKIEETASEPKKRPLNQAEVNEAVILYKKALGDNMQAQGLFQRSIGIEPPEKLIIVLLEEQVELFKQHEAHFLRFMRNRFANQAISLEVSVTKPDTRPQLYTSQQRYDYLKEKHPLLEKLKTTLRLEVDF